MKKALLAINVFAILIIVAMLLWQAPAIISMLNNPYSGSGYSKFMLVVGEGQIIRLDNSAYTLWYLGQNVVPSFSGDTNPQFIATLYAALNTSYYDAVQGATYNGLGIQIIVGEVHNDYLILYIKSTIP